jgi:hypothetical protein
MTNKIKAMKAVFRHLFGSDFKEIEITRLDDDTGEVEYTPMGNGGALGVDIIHNENDGKFLAVTYYYNPGVRYYPDGSGEPPSWEPVEHEWRDNILDVARDIMMFKLDEDIAGLSEELLFIDIEEHDESYYKR